MSENFKVKKIAIFHEEHIEWVKCMMSGWYIFGLIRLVEFQVLLSPKDMNMQFLSALNEDSAHANGFIHLIRCIKWLQNYNFYCSIFHKQKNQSKIVKIKLHFFFRSKIAQIHSREHKDLISDNNKYTSYKFIHEIKINSFLLQ